MNLLLLAVLALSLFDYLFTRRRLGVLGKLYLERNPLLHVLMKWLGPDSALAITIFLPSAAIAVTFYGLGWTIPLSIYLGMRLQLTWMQILSLELERRIREELPKE